jgi:hypothetical protein
MKTGILFGLVLFNLTIFCYGGARGQVKLDSGLVAYYPFSGNAVDSSGNGNNGTINGAVLSLDRFGNSNRSYSFNGVSDYIQVPHSNSLNLTGDLTISSWFRSITPINNYQTIIAKRDETFGFAYPWSLGISYAAGSSGTEYKKAFFGIRDSLGATHYHFTGDTIQQNTWEHLLVVVRNDTSLIYLNGQLDTAKAITILRSGNTFPMNIGWNKIPGSEQMFGNIDDIRIYNRAINASEIQALYQQGITSDTATTWKLRVSASADLLSDDLHFLGIAKSANDGFDPSYDTPEAPQPPGSYLQVYFPHPEWNQLLGDNFANDVRAEHALGDTVLQWKFDVSTNLTGTIVSMTFLSDGRIPTGYGMLLKDLTDGTRKNIKAGGMSYSYNSGSGGIRHFEIMIGDSTPPAIAVLKPNGGEIIRAKNNYNLQWNNSDGTGIDSAVISTSTDTGHSYQHLTTLHGLYSTFAWTAPPAYLNYGGSIKVTVVDSVGNSASDVSDHTFTTAGDSLSNNFSAGWNLFGAPLKPSDFSVAGTFSDNINEAFYVMEYSPTAGYSLPDSVKPGRGYWLGLLHNFRVDVKGTAVTDSTVIPLSQGFGIIADPLVLPLPKGVLKFRKSGAIVSYDSAIAKGWIATGIQKYDQSSHSYQSVDSLLLWGGYWLGTLQTGVDLIASPPPGGTVPLPKAPQSSAAGWLVNMTASTSTSSDQAMYFGVRTDAIEGFDGRYDQPKPPLPPGGRYIESYFSHPDWAPVLGNKFNGDIKPDGALIWSFIVAPSENSTVTLNWDANQIKTSVPDSIRLLLTDVISGAVTDMKKTYSYSFTTADPRQFTINGNVLGVKDNMGIPEQFSLAQNYPNPFNPATIISYQLPVSAYVTLKVFNPLGQEITTLIDEHQEPGIKTVKFEMSGLPSGIYFYRIAAGTFTDVKKMVLMK